MSRPKRPRPKCPWPKCPSTVYIMVNLIRLLLQCTCISHTGSVFSLTLLLLVFVVTNNLIWVLKANVGHFGHGHFGLGRFGPDISATENAKGGRFDHNHKLWVGDGIKYYIK